MFLYLSLGGSGPTPNLFFMTSCACFMRLNLLVIFVIMFLEQQAFLEKLRKMDEDRRREEELKTQGETSGVQDQGASAKSRPTLTPVRKAQIAAQKEALSIQKKFEGNLQSLLPSPESSSGSSSMDLASVSATEAPVCTCPECPFANISKF